jgi:hypothetical protein
LKIPKKSGIASIELVMAFNDDLMAGASADINIRPSGHGLGVGVYK